MVRGGHPVSFRKFWGHWGYDLSLYIVAGGQYTNSGVSVLPFLHLQNFSNHIKTSVCTYFNVAMHCKKLWESNPSSPGNVLQPLGYSQVKTVEYLSNSWIERGVYQYQSVLSFGRTFFTTGSGLSSFWWSLVWVTLLSILSWSSSPGERLGTQTEPGMQLD